MSQRPAVTSEALVKPVHLASELIQVTESTTDERESQQGVTVRPNARP